MSQQLTVRELLEQLETERTGLSSKEAAIRLANFGPNRLTQAKKKNYFLSYLKEFGGFFPILLEVAALLAFIADAVQPGEGNDILGIAILVAVLANATFTFWQKFKADKAMEALLQLMKSTARVWREGELIEIDAQEVVPGDILFLEEGDKVAADGILLESNDLYLNLSILNGESRPTERQALETFAFPITLESPNSVFAGTVVTRGNGLAVVTATGDATEFGKIAKMTTQIQKVETPIEKEIKHMTKVLTLLALAAGLLFFVLGVFNDRGWLISAIFALSLIVANVPEGLLPTITLSLSLASQRMARRKALIKNLNSVQTLGSATVICTDKTGTLTKNEMTLKGFYLPSGCLGEVGGEGYEVKGEVKLNDGSCRETDLKAVEELAKAAAVNVHASLTQEGVQGDPTEIALLVFAKKLGVNLAQLPEKIKEYAFTSERKMMSTVVNPAQPILFSKGAPETILQLCTQVQMPDGVQPLTEELRQAILQQNEEFAEQAYRVLAIAKAEGTQEENMVFLGLVALIDPPREGVKEAIKTCYQAGIDVIMMTGDNPLTAKAIAGRIGLKVSQVMLGSELDDYGNAELKKILAQKHLLFARMTSEQKLRIAQLLQANGEVVAMTGDGVNDAPALKQADIGVAMGSGTDVAKEAGDMILLNNHFGAIVAAIEEGRAVYFNIKKLTTYILSSNVPEIVPYVLSFFLKIPMPLSVIQILLIDLGSDQVPGLGLGTETPEKRTMQRPPVGKQEKILDWEVFKRGYFMNGVFEGAAAMFAFLGFLWLSGWHYGDVNIDENWHRQAMTMTLLGAITCQMLNVFTLRSWEDNIWNLSHSNKWIWLGVVIELVFILLLLYNESVQSVFQTATVPAEYLWLLLPFPILLLLNHEWYKWRKRRMAEA